MAAQIASSASVDARAELGDDVEVGPFCVIGPEVRIGRGTRLVANVHIMGRTSIGELNLLYPGAVLGGQPQDHSDPGEDTRLTGG